MEKKVVKEIHIVFQILNFITSPQAHFYKLTADEKLFILVLAKHKGQKGIYPSLNTLAKELNRHPSSVKRTLKRLEQKGLIYVERGMGRSSHYYLTFPEGYLSTTGSVHATTYTHGGGSVHATGGVASTHTTGSVHATQSIQRIYKNKNTEGERTKRALPLPDDFEPTKASVQLAKDLGLPEHEFVDELEKFMDYYIGEGCSKVDWQRVFQAWLKRAVRFQEEKPVKNEIRSTVKDFEPAPHYDRAADKEVATQALSQILGKLKLNGKGGHDGNESHGQVEEGKGSQTQ